MSSPEARKARARARLQNRLDDQHSKNLSLPELCEQDASRLNGHILAVTGMGIPDMNSPLWTDVICWLEEGVRRLSITAETIRHPSRDSFHMDSTATAKNQHIEDAKQVLERLQQRVLKLPIGQRLERPARLGFKHTSVVGRKEAAHANNGNDPFGNQGFAAATRDFQNLGIPLPATSGPSTGTPIDSDQWVKLLVGMSQNLEEFKISHEAR